jgi:hypothetical protein
MKMKKIICERCGCELEEDEAYFVEDDILCEECLEQNTVTCDHCGERLYVSDAVFDDDTTLCQRCFDDYYYRCESCGRIVRDNDVSWHCDLPYCYSCFDEIEEEEEIADYSFKPEPIFYGENDRYFGVELEVDNGGKESENARQLKDLVNVSDEHIYIKSDGSLDDGFEVVTHPMTLYYHTHQMDWKTLLQKAIHLGYRSHQTSTCGLHVHVNRTAFGKNQAEQEEVIAKILYFVEKHWNELYKFSRRSEHNINRWSARYGFEKTGKAILDKAKDCSYGRYTAVNLCNYSTIEFRIFRGTLKYNTLIATLQMVNRICDVAVSFCESELEKLSWSDFISQITEPELIQYLKERQLYINETVETEEEV